MSQLYNNSNYLSSSSEIVQLEWTGEQFYKLIKLYGVKLTVACDGSDWGTIFDFKLTVKFQSENFIYANNECVVILKGKDQQKVKNLKNHETISFQLDGQNLFIEKWCVNINNKKYLTLNFWIKNEPDEQQRVLDLTDGIITTYKYKFLVNNCILAKSSKIIYNMIQDLKLSQNSNDPVDFGILFENFGERHIFMYLCFVYNQNFRFFFLHDIIQVLKICIKLDCQNMIDRIMNMQYLGNIVREQLITDSEKSENSCYVKNVLSFSAKHGLYNLIVYCQLQNMSENPEKKVYPNMLQSLCAAYENTYINLCNN